MTPTLALFLSTHTLTLKRRLSWSNKRHHTIFSSLSLSLLCLCIFLPFLSLFSRVCVHEILNRSRVRMVWGGGTHSNWPEQCICGCCFSLAEFEREKCQTLNERISQMKGCILSSWSALTTSWTSTLLEGRWTLNQDIKLVFHLWWDIR